MIRVIIFSGDLASRNPGKQLAVLDVAYAKKSHLSNYLVALSLRGLGEVAPDAVTNYPRWSASLWDLVARALTRVLYRDNQAPALGEPDRRCAYATQICAVIEKATLTERGVELGTVEIAQKDGQRGHYTASFTEDILGPREAHFEYGMKSLNIADLLLRAICWALFGKDTLGPTPRLILPPTLKLADTDHFHLEALNEPAKTGFLRFIAQGPTSAAANDPLPKAASYVHFLMEG